MGLISTSCNNVTDQINWINSKFFDRKIHSWPDNNAGRYIFDRTKSCQNAPVDEELLFVSSSEVPIPSSWVWSVPESAKSKIIMIKIKEFRETYFVIHFWIIFQCYLKSSKSCLKLELKGIPESKFRTPFCILSHLHKM